jgi:F420H(2)-dependent quinone reductase
LEVIGGLRYRSVADDARQMGLRFERWFTRVHPRIYLATRGWIGHRLGWYPSLILETTGRRSGFPRNVVLPYIRQGGAYLVVASNFGGERPPDWLLNLKAHPSVRVQIRRARFDATAEAMFPGDATFEDLWRAVTRDGRRGPYEKYRELTSRPIPVVRIAPRQ